LRQDRENQCGGRPCEQYFLVARGEYLRDLPDLFCTPAAAGWISGSVVETGVADSTGSRIQVTWYVDGRFLQDGEAELSVTSGGFAITDTLPLCP
jgi:hypothetical protein